ncbi:lipase member H-like isoform X2 [Athalia rosae]|uniref:lipase member H-like isoform X2 n=1 Tax=Athalia rosae TaxID=37344 RepID=UPI0020348EEC|nr:lipase member H-like isoform X2 [Athalia rosae]
MRGYEQDKYLIDSPGVLQFTANMYKKYRVHYAIFTYSIDMVRGSLCDTFAICITVFCIMPLINAEITLDPEKITVFMLSGTCADRKIPGTNLQDVSSCLDPTLKTVIIIHGFLESCTEEAVYITIINKAYQGLGIYNVICIDWSPYCTSFLGYPTAVAYSKLVADLLVVLVAHLDARGIDRTQLDFVGFSMGAQVAGMVGNCITNPPLYRIIGLDPASPGYTPQISDVGHMTPNSATIVVGVYTDRGFFGVFEPCGSHNFFPNGGTRIQPNCSDGLTLDILTAVTELPNSFSSGQIIMCSKFVWTPEDYVNYFFIPFDV